MSKGKSNDFDDSIVNDLKQMIEDSSPYAKIYRMAADHISRDNSVDVKLRLIGKRSRDGRTYNMPTTTEVATLIVGDFECMPDKRDPKRERKKKDESQSSDPSKKKKNNEEESEESKRNNLTLREFLAFRMQDREDEGQQLLLSRRLLQQFIVDGYTMMETQMLQWIRYNQPSLRSERYNNLNDSKNKGNTDSSCVGKPLILPSSFTGGKWWTGYPSLFITFTCNPKWPEISRFVKKRELRPEDRQDISVRIFRIKLRELLADLKSGKVFGQPTAQIPKIEENLELDNAVAECMMHGPDRLNSPCMVNSKCSKRYPKDYTDHTKLDDNGYPTYMRRDTGITGQSVKYLFKYINKGSDRMGARITKTNNDEISEYVDCRYIYACEAMWRIFEFKIHHRTPHIERLSFHLEGEQTCVFREGDYIDNVLVKNTIAESQFLQWMEINKTDPDARKLLYSEFPQHYVWNVKDQVWTKRDRGFGIGRIFHVSPSTGKIYHLRILLNHVRGATCYEDFRRVNGELKESYKEACYAMGLLDDDKEYIEGIIEASSWDFGDYLRRHFTTLQYVNGGESVGTNLGDCYQTTSFTLSERVLKIQLTNDQIKNITLAEIEKLLIANSSSLIRFPGMPMPNETIISDAENPLILEETSYSMEDMRAEHAKLYPCLTDKQRMVYQKIINAIDSGEG
ncbi:uncharacterized protein LOC131025943 [Salvia miltiorrhiza]|uniref:uncharacterized protein LOC131025943 n=1 Tax=Salvia miltiorrhiza TaxID=226208 RepID=UPI0025AC609E|nr:uncharacterized protein LOC131025943 [Salvia miltiorrhiza]